MTALLALAGSDAILLWDPEDRTLIAANVVGTWLAPTGLTRVAVTTPGRGAVQRNGEWRYLEFLQVTSSITADLFMREIPGGTRARYRSRPVDLPEHRY